MIELSDKTILIFILVFLVVVGLLLYFLVFRKKSKSNSTSCSLDKDCSDGKLCDAKNGNCIKCEVNQTLCGNICMNSPQQTCINGIIYDTINVCDNNPAKPVICDNVKTQCDPVRKVCVNCEKDLVLCNGVCCPDNHFCDKNAKTCSPCATDTFVCGNICCNTGDKCSGKENSKCCPDTEMCGEICCDSKSSCTSDHKCCSTTSLCTGKDGTVECLTGNQECTVDGPCNPDNIYITKDSIKHCCMNPVCGGICCDSGESCDPQNNTCKIKCGAAFCTPSTQKCITDDNTKKSYCLTNGCVWDEIEYNPPNILYGQANPQKQLEVCQDGTGNLWATYNPNLTKTSSDVQSSTSQHDCQLNDCVYRSAEKGSDKSDFDANKKTCNSIYDCKNILQTTLTVCPLDNPKSCCTDATGKLTGQVCPDSQSCIDGICGGGYYCHQDGQCVLSQDKHYPNVPLFIDRTSCVNKCIPSTIVDDSQWAPCDAPGFWGIGCSYGKDAYIANGCETSFAKSLTDNSKYNWQCSAQYDGSDIKHYSHSNCSIASNCNGTAKDQSIYAPTS